jgi:NAD(P)-dependent dehydrogenase (short-subunit alcohol dehydrogenase family)
MEPACPFPDEADRLAREMERTMVRPMRGYRRHCERNAAIQRASEAALDRFAPLALFLRRDEAASITGANMSMDGGWTAA